MKHKEGIDLRDIVCLESKKFVQRYVSAIHIGEPVLNSYIICSSTRLLRS